MLFVLGSVLPWFSAVVGETNTLISPRPIDDVEVGWMLIPAAVVLTVLLLVLTRVDGMAYRLVALAGLCLSGFLAFMVVAILNVEHLGTDEYVIHIGRSITILATYFLVAGCALALVSPTTRFDGLPLRTHIGRFRSQQVSGF